jgi:outer membrane protein assembly factor BamB
MKIQCPCGAKYAIDVTPGMQPVQFICPNCGGDYSAAVNDMIQRELAQNFPSSQSQQPSAPAAPGLRISRGHEPSAPAAPAAPAEPVEGAVCAKHNEPATEQCAVCHKPICPKCMDIFGFFCSALCKSKAEVGKMNVPAYAGSTFANEHRFWRKLGWISGGVGTFAVIGLGVWIWYSWIASMPHSYFTVTFDQISHSGSSYIDNGQIVFLHGGTLARYDLKTGKQVWSKELVSEDQIDAVVNGANAAQAQAREANPDEVRQPLPSMVQKYARIGLESALSLQCAGQNIWVAGNGQLTQYDWNSGNVLQQIATAGDESSVQGNNLLAFGRADDGSPSVVQVDLTSGNVTMNEFHDASVSALAGNTSTPAGVVPASAGGAGLPLSPYGSSQPMDSQRVSQQVQNLSLQGQIALPAILANNSYEQRLEGAMNDGQQQRRRPPPQAYARPPAAAGTQPTQSPPQDFTLIPDNGAYEEFSSQMTQENFVQREAMKQPEKNSALESVTGGNETDAINEQLNDMQRQKGADTVTEDQSTYSVTIRQAGNPSASWTGDVTGPPQLIPLKTVNVLAAGKTVIVLDKSNKKLWQTVLTYDITGGDQQSSLEGSPYGNGPCVEKDGTLYVFDQAVLSAFDVTTGDARWRIPTVGVVGLFFDARGMLYVNTTTGNPDDIKYSRQIDVTKSTEAVILKMNPATGKILWSSNGSGYICYLSGPFIYTLQSFDPGDEEDQLSDATAGLMKPPLTRIIRIDPSDGHAMWQWDQDWAPMNVQFNDNFIRIIFKKEVQVLHFLSL